MPLYLNGTDGVYGVNGTNATPAVRGSDTTGNGIFYGTDTVSVATNGTTAVTVDSSGNLQIGYGGQSPTSVTAPQGISLTSPASTALQIYMLKAAQVESHIGFKTSTDTNFYVGTGGGQGPGGVGAYGTFQANLSNSWSSVSDERVKVIIEPIENAIPKINQLRSVIGRFTYDTEDKRRSFLIAQDVQAVLPEAVTIADQETQTLGLSYTDVIPLLVASIKELSAKLDAAEARIAALEAK